LYFLSFNELSQQTNAY